MQHSTTTNKRASRTGEVGTRKRQMESIEVKKKICEMGLWDKMILVS